MLDVVGGPMTFAGTGSKLADRQLLKKAKSMLSGKSPKDRIWDEDSIGVRQGGTKTLMGSGSLR